MKLKYGHGPYDPVIIDISFVNNARVREYIWLPTAIIRGILFCSYIIQYNFNLYFYQPTVDVLSQNISEIDNMEISLKINFVPHSPVDSTADLKLNIRAKEMRSYERAYSNDYISGHYNLTSTLKLTQLDNSR